jgi:hypothetical protein
MHAVIDRQKNHGIHFRGTPLKGMENLIQTMDLSPWETEVAQIASAASFTYYLS